MALLSLRHSGQIQNSARVRTHAVTHTSLYGAHHQSFASQYPGNQSVRNSNLPQTVILRQPRGPDDPDQIRSWLL